MAIKNNSRNGGAATEYAADAVLRVRIATLGRQRILAVRRAD